MQNLFPVPFLPSVIFSGPSSNRCPKCEPQFAHLTSTLVIPKLLSSDNSILSSSIAFQKLGQPVPESYFLSEVKSGDPHAIHLYTPFSLLFNNSPENGVSGAFSLKTLYCSPVSFFFQKSSDLFFVSFYLPKFCE